MPSSNKSLSSDSGAGSVVSLVSLFSNESTHGINSIGRIKVKKTKLRAEIITSWRRNMWEHVERNGVLLKLARDLKTNIN